MSNFLWRICPRDSKMNFTNMSAFKNEAISQECTCCPCNGICLGLLLLCIALIIIIITLLAVSRKFWLQWQHWFHNKPRKSHDTRQLLEDVEAAIDHEPDLSQKLSAKENELKIMKVEMQQRDGEIQNLRRNELQYNDEISSLRKTIDGLTNRLSEEMSSKVAANESAVENISIKNRPMNVAEEYHLMCSNEWLNAKSDVDDSVSETMDVPEYCRISLLREVMKVTYESVQDRFIVIENQVKSFIASLSDPLCEQNKALAPEKESQAPTGRALGLQNAIGDFLRNQSDMVDYNDIIQVVHSAVEEHLKSHSISESLDLWQRCKHSEFITAYVQKSAMIAWKMMVQRPAMTFHFTDSYLGEKHQELHWQSYCGEGSKAFEVHPVLYHGTSVMAKGKVYLVDSMSLK